MGCDSYNHLRLRIFHLKNKNNPQIYYFENHQVFTPRSHWYRVDYMNVIICKNDTLVRIPPGLIGIKDGSRISYKDRANEILEGEEREYYLDIYRHYDALSVCSIFGHGLSSGCIEIESVFNRT